MESVIESWDDLLLMDDTDYTTVPIGDGSKSVRLGSLSAADMLQWLHDNEDDEKRKTNGLVLVAKSMVNPKGERIGNLAEMLKLREKQPKTVKKLVAAAVALNELNVKEPEKNGLSEALPVASPTASVSQ